MGYDLARETGKYWAFVSYSHCDSRFAAWLHAALERYTVPKRLLEGTGFEQVPKRLSPVFRDRDELPAATDLTAEVHAALRRSRSLIVVCSKTAATSKWVAREIEVFRELHPDRPVLTAIVRDEPPDCFPPVLCCLGTQDRRIEPLAADFRRGRDGARLGLLKIVAGVAGVPLAALVQRDAQRRARGVMAITAAAVAAMLITGSLGLLAWQARNDAVYQRSRAEGLVEFMLGNLRHKLERVGRLDVMDDVNRQVLDYYSSQDLSALPVHSLELWADLLHALGENYERRGNYGRARTSFEEAARTTAALLTKDPDDPPRIFAHAQSEYYLGEVDFARGKYAEAKLSFQNYRQLALRLMQLGPADPASEQELAYADSNLCTVALQRPVDLHGARYCREALMETEQANRGRSMTRELVAILIERHAWLADAYRAQKLYEKARAERLLERKLLRSLMSSYPRDKDLIETWMALEIALAELDNDQGHTQKAISSMGDALLTATDLNRFDPSNHDWTEQHHFIVSELARWKAQLTNGGNHANTN